MSEPEAEIEGGELTFSLFALIGGTNIYVRLRAGLWISSCAANGH